MRLQTFVDETCTPSRYRFCHFPTLGMEERSAGEKGYPVRTGSISCLLFVVYHLPLFIRLVSPATILRMEKVQESGEKHISWGAHFRTEESQESSQGVYRLFRSFCTSCSSASPKSVCLHWRGPRPNIQRESPRDNIARMRLILLARIECKS